MKWMICLAGAFGGIAPNVFRMGTNLTAGKELPDVSYLIGVLIFAGMGAGLVASFGEDNAKKAFFLGLSLPALFQSSVSDLSNSPSRVSELLFPPAYAATISSSEQAQKPLVLAFDQEAQAFGVVFVGKERKELLEVDLLKGPVPRELMAPAWATEFFVIVGDSQGPSRIIPPPGRLGVREFDYYVGIRLNPWDGLKQSVGIRGGARFIIELLTEAELEKKR